MPRLRQLRRMMVLAILLLAAPALAAARDVVGEDDRNRIPAEFLPRIGG